MSSGGKEECLQPVLENTRIEAVYGREKVERIISTDIEKKTTRTDEEQKVIETSGSKFPPQDYAYSLNTNSRIRIGYYGMEGNWKILGTSLYHFIPNYLISYSSYKDQLKRELRECLMSGKKYYIDSEEDIKRVLPIIAGKVYEAVDDIYEKKTFRDVDKYEKARTLIKKKITIINERRKTLILTNK